MRRDLRTRLLPAILLFAVGGIASIIGGAIAGGIALLILAAVSLGIAAVAGRRRAR